MAKATATVVKEIESMSRGEMLENIAKVRHYIQSHPEDTMTQLYEAVDGVSRTALELTKAEARPGWYAKIMGEQGKPLWATAQQASALENIAPIAEALLGGARKQRGGAGENLFKFGPDSKLIEPTGDTGVSIDKIYDQVTNFLASVDETNRELASVIGPVAFVKGMTTDPQIGPFPPYLPTPVKIPSRTILPLINAFLETCRILVSNQFVDISIARQILSLVLALFDVSRGEWRDGVLSFLGVFSRNMMLAGLVGKIMRWVYNFMSPDIQSRLSDDLFEGGKSMFLGFWLWFISTVSPDFVRMAVNQMIESAKLPLEQLNQQIGAIEEQAKAVGASVGVGVEFPRVPLDAIPSFDDIQNFQALAHQPEIVCSVGFQAAIQPALAIPALRLVLELLNIPTTAEDKAEFCRGQPQDVADAISKAFTPTVFPLETSVVQQSAGRRATRRRHHKKQKQTKKRRT
jgi:hypothetical protein